MSRLRRCELDFEYRDLFIRLLILMELGELVAIPASTSFPA